MLQPRDAWFIKHVYGTRPVILINLHNGTQWQERNTDMSSYWIAVSDLPNGTKG